MNIKLIDTYDDLTDIDILSLKDQNISLDDWDFILICPKTSVYSYINEETKKLTWRPYSYNLEKIIGDNDYSVWYNEIMFRGNKVAVGIKYH